MLTGSPLRMKWDRRMKFSNGSSHSLGLTKTFSLVLVLRLSGRERSTMRCEGLGRDAVDWCRKRCPHQGLRAKVPGVRCHDGEEWGKTDKTDDRRICK